MSAIADIDPSKLRRYLYEYALLALCACVIYLFVLYTSMNKYIRDELLKANIQQSTLINENTKALEKNTEAFNRNEERVNPKRKKQDIIYED